MMKKMENKMTNKWKRILTVMLTLAMLTQNCYTIMAAMEDTPQSEQTILLQDVGDTGNAGGDIAAEGAARGNFGDDQGAAGDGSGIETGGDGIGNGSGIGTSGDGTGNGSGVGTGEDGTGGGNGMDSGEGSGDQGFGDGGNVDGGNLGSGDLDDGNSGADGSGSDEGTGDTGNDSGNIDGDSGNIDGDSGNVDGDSGNIDGDSGNIDGDNGNIDGDNGNVDDGNDNGNIDGGNADNDSEGNDGEEEEEPAPETTGSAAIDVLESVYIEKIDYSYEAPEGENPWSDILSVSSVDESEAPSDLNEFFSKRNQSVVYSEFFKVTSSDEKDNIPTFTASLKQGISLADNQELYFYSNGSYSLTDISGSSILTIPYGTVWGFAAVQKNEAKVYNISKGQQYEDWIDQDNTALYYKNGDSWVKYVTDSDHEFVSGEEIKVGIAYQVPKGVTIYPGDKIYCQIDLGDSGTVFNNQYNVNITLDGSDTVVGHFDIDSNGMITVSYDENWLTKGDSYGRDGISTRLEASGSLKFSDSGDENGYKTIYIGSLELKYKVGQKVNQAGIIVKKDKKGTWTQDESGNIFQNFAVTITAKKINTIPITKLSVYDYFENGQKKFVEYIEDSWNVDSKPNGLDVKISKAAGSDSQSLYLDLDITGNGDKGGFGGEGQTEIIVISYKVKINKDIWFGNFSGSNGSYTSNLTLRNTAEVNGDEVTDKASDWEDLKITKTWFNKTGSVVSNAADGKARIHYAVHINQRPVVDISGWTVRDTLQQPETLHAYDPNSIVVIKYDSNNKKIGEFTPEVKTEDKGGKTYQYIEFMADGPFYYLLQYDTIVTLDDGQFSAGELKNKIELIAPDGLSIGKAPSYTIGVNYHVFSIKKEVLGTPDFAGRKITWQTTLEALKNGGTNGEIPDGAVYKDVLSLDKFAESHMFDWDKLNLVIKDRNNVILTENTDYTLAKADDKKSFEVQFLRTVSGPVKITYNSSADFGKGEGKDEIYKNTGTLTVLADVKSAAANFVYNSKDMIKKQVYKEYNPNTREISWKIVVNSTKRTYSLDTKYIVVDHVPEGLKVKEVRYETQSNELHDHRIVDGDVIIDYTGFMKEINGKTRNIIIVTEVEDTSSLEGGKGQLSFTNETSLYIEDKLINTASATAKAKFEVLNKTAKYDKNSPNRFVEYTVDVNTAGSTLGNGTGNLKFIDQMDSNMYLDIESVKVINLYTGADITSSCKCSVDIKNHKFTLDIPNSTPLKISYNVNFNEYADKVVLENTAKLFYEEMFIEGNTNKQEFEVKQASGSASANPDIYVQKVDKSDAFLHLEGATFNLYRLKDGGDPESADFQSNWIFKNKLITDENGKIVISNLEKETFYCLTEIEGPDGYVWDPSAKNIFICADKDFSGQLPENCVQISENNGGLTITNSKPQLAIDKKFYGGDGTQLMEGQYPDGSYYFGVFNENGEIVQNGSSGRAFGKIQVTDGRIVMSESSLVENYPLAFELQMGHYTVYETDALGNILEDTDNDGYVIVNGMKFEADAQGHISTEITVDKNAYPAVAVVKNKLHSDDVQFTLRVSKELEGREMAPEEFRFGIFDDKDEMAAVGVNDNAGNVKFAPISYTFESVGEHTTRSRK